MGLPRFGARKTAPPPRRRATIQPEDDGQKFRRGRSLTGSLVDEVRAPAENTGQLQSARVEAQNKRQKRRLTMRRAMLVAVVVLGLYALYAHHIRSFAVQFVTQPQKMPNIAAYEASAMQFASSSFDNRFTPSLDKEKLASFLMQKHTEIASVRVTTGVFDASPTLAVTLRKPVLIWQTKHDAQAFYVDASGTSFSFDAMQTAGLVPINDESGVAADLGVPVASSRQISFLGQFVGQIEESSAAKLVIAKIVFPPSSTKEIHVHFKDKPYFAKVYLERSPRAQAEAAVKGIAHLDAKGIAPAEYIDVRVAEKLFYK